MDLIEYADKQIAELEAALKVLREQKMILGAARAAKSKPIVEVVATTAERTRRRIEIAQAATVAPAKRGRKLGERPLTQRILELLESGSVFIVSYIASELDIAEPRKVSFALQHLSKAGKVERFGNGWRIPRDPAPAEETVNIDGANVPMSDLPIIDPEALRAAAE